MEHYYFSNLGEKIDDLKNTFKPTEPLHVSYRHNIFYAKTIFHGRRFLNSVIFNKLRSYVRSLDLCLKIN